MLSSLFIDLQSQNFVWAKREGLWAYDYGYGISADNENVYVAGKYEMASNFSGIILPDHGNHDIYVAQYSSTGTLNWIRTAGGRLGDYAESLFCDGSSLYIAGEIEGYNDIITFDGSPITLNCISDNDIFLAKYNLKGDLLWAVSEGGLDGEKALGITADNYGNVYICGYFQGSCDFSGVTITESGNKDIYIAKYDKNGIFQWVRQGGSAGRDEAKSIKCDAAGNIYITGMYSNGAVFGNITLTTSSVPTGSFYNVFLAKYAPDGSIIWIKQAGGDYDDVAWGVTIDKANKIYITGEFNAYALFDAIPLTTNGNADIFVACYDQLGNAQWAKSAGGILIDRARGIGTDGTTLYITGQFGSTVLFDTYTVTAADSSDIFIASINSSGNFLWATSVGGPPDALETLSYESGNAICADASGYVYATGALLDGGIFGSTTLNKYGRTDAFITKITQSTIGVTEQEDQENNYLYPNPTNGLLYLKINQLKNAKTDKIEILNSIGQKIYEVDGVKDQSSSNVQIDLSSLKKGIYFVEFISEAQEIFLKKLIIQ